MRIYVQPAFWQTPQAVLLATVVLVGAAAIAISFGVRSSQKQQRRLNRQISDKTAELEKANQELEAFNYTVSHDLQSPLMNLSHYIQLLRETPEESDRDHETILSKINEITHRMRKLVRDLLFFSRSSTATFSPHETNLYILCLDVVNEVKDEQSATIEFSGPLDVPVEADEGLLKIAIKNIVQNSLKFSPEPERLEIRLTVEEAGWATVYRLADNGSTIDERFRQHIFKPFNRGAASTTEEGTGIGLAIVQRVMRRHGGAVWIEETPGGGTTVAFTLAEKQEVD
jgi:signal transduction histidine kinase